MNPSGLPMYCWATARPGDPAGSARYSSMRGLKSSPSPPNCSSLSVKKPITFGSLASGATWVAATSSALVTNEGANQSSPLAIDSCTSKGIDVPRVLLSEKGPRVLKPHDRNLGSVAASHAAVLG